MNIDMNSVLYLFLFILPGAFSKILRRRFSPIHLSVERNKSSLIETSEIVVISFVIFCLNNLFIKVCGSAKGLSEEISIINNLDNTDFLVRYILLTFVMTALFTYCHFYFDRVLISKGINLYNKLMDLPEESENRTIWEDIFETTNYLDYKEGFIVVSIEKDGKVLSRGMLREFPSPNSDCDELILVNCAEIEKYFEYDESVEPEDKFFWKTDFEYTILSKGITLKFYNLDKYREFADSTESE